MKINIAIANPRSLIRQAIVRMINGFTDCEVIIHVDNAIDLTNKIADKECTINICIIDIGMPEQNGYNAILSLRKKYPDLGFLVLTQYFTEFSLITMIKNGANGYLLDNCSPNDLNKAILDIYHHGYYYSNIASEKVFRLVKNNHLLYLTEKELQFLSLFCTELTFEKIGELMHVSTRTVQAYQQSIGDKLNIHSRVGLALFAVHSGLEPLTKR